MNSFLHKTNEQKSTDVPSRTGDRNGAVKPKGLTDNRPVSQLRRKRIAGIEAAFRATSDPIQRVTTTAPVPKDIQGVQGAYVHGFSVNNGDVHEDPMDMKMHLLNALSHQIQAQNNDFAPHVALSFHAGIVRVAVNRGHAGSGATNQELEDATLTVLQTQAGHMAGIPAQIQPWFNKYYNGGHPVIRALNHDDVGIAIPQGRTVHAEQLVSRDVVNQEQAAAAIAPLAANTYRAQGGQIKPIPAGHKKVVRIGGMLEDCAFCHIDHHGAPVVLGHTQAGNPRLARTADMAMVFRGVGDSTDANLHPNGKAIMSSGTHFRAARGVAPQAPASQPGIQVNPNQQGITVPTQQV